MGYIDLAFIPISNQKPVGFNLIFVHDPLDNIQKAMFLTRIDVFGIIFKIHKYRQIDLFYYKYEHACPHYFKKVDLHKK